MNDLATQAFISRRVGRPRSVKMTVNTMAQEMTRDLGRIAQLSVAQGASVAETLGSLERVSKLLVDVSDLAVITQPVS